MSKVDWSLAPKWADHVVSGPLSGVNYWANDERRIQFGGEFDCKDNNHVNEGWAVVESKPATWSGPQDGLPTVGTVCELRTKSGGWGEAEIKYQGRRGICVWLWVRRDGNCEQVEWAESPDKLEFRAIKTPEQLAAEQRETAIREIMDIADVDCRVTAARLVDAGFKREVV